VIALILLLSLVSAPADITIDADTVSVGALFAFSLDDPRAAISLGYAPNPGLARRITKQEILNKITSAGQRTDDLQIPESILVHRQASGLDRSQVMQAILDAFTQRFPAANVEITNLEIPNVQVGTGPLDITASLPPRFDTALPVFVRVNVRGTSFAKTVFIRTSARVETNQPVLKNRVAAHAQIQPDDIEWKMAPVRPSAPAERVEGLLTKRSLEPGEIVTNDLLYPPLYVRKGDSVTVKATAGSVTIAATMRAKAAGKMGDTIPVEHLSGEGSTMARIVGPRLLEVN
jgi:flagella basal body P-ring formation protein FlgA